MNVLTQAEQDYLDKGTKRMLMSSVEFHVLCVEVGLDLGRHVIIGVVPRFHHADAIPSTEFFPSGFCCCHRELDLEKINKQRKKRKTKKKKGNRKKKEKRKKKKKKRKKKKRKKEKKNEKEKKKQSQKFFCEINSTPEKRYFSHGRSFL